MPPLLISHRTHLGTHPENSRSGLLAALDDGVDGIEIDVRATRDRRIVLIHDRSMERTHGVRRYIDRVDYADLPRFTGPTAPILPLDEALSMCAGRSRLVIDVKQHGIARQLEATLHAFTDRVEAWVWTHDPAIARECIDTLRGSHPVSLIVRPHQASLWGSDAGLRLARSRGLDGLLFEHPDLSAGLITRANEAGLTLHCGRTNDPADIARVFEANPASMCSDFPAVAQAVAASSPALAPVT